MNIRHLYIYIIGVCVLLSSNTLLAQEDTRPLLADVELQKIFIDANKEKLLEHYQDAAFLYQEVLKKDPKNHAAAYELARMYDVLEKDALALISIEKAVRLAPDNIWYKDMYALILDDNKKYNKAATIYGELAKSYPDNEYFLFQQALYFVKAKRPEKAVVIYDKLERRMGINEDLTQKKYILYHGMKDNKKAVAEIKRLTQAFPESTNYLHILADFYLSIKQTDKAKEVYKKILQLDAKDGKALLAIAEDKKKDGNHTAYLKSIHSTIKDKNVDIDLKVKQLFPYISKLKTSKDTTFQTTALSLGETLFNTHPKEAKAHSLYADMLFHAQEYEKALKYYESTLELENSVYAVWEQILYLNINMKNYKTAIEKSEKAMDFFPNQARLYYLNGIAQSSLNQHTKAVNMFQQALMMAGKKTELKHELYNLLGMEYAILKKYSQSNKMFDKALVINPKSYSVLYNYSHQLTLRSEDLTKARKMATLANELKKNDPLLLANLGHIDLLLKNDTQAETHLRKSLENGGETMPYALEVYGDILFKKGEKNKALLQWKKAKKLSGAALSPSLEKKINSLLKEEQ